MIRLGRRTSALLQQTVASNGTNGFLVVDTRPTTGERFDALEWNVLIGPGAATTAPTTLALTESADTNASNYSAIQAFTGGTAVNTTSSFVLPSIATSAGSGYHVAFNVNLRKDRKRYQKLSVVPGTTASVAIISNLRQPNQSIAPNTTGSGGDVFIVG